MAGQVKSRVQVRAEQIHLFPPSSTYLAEASDLGFAVGEWPDVIVVPGKQTQTLVFEKNRQIQRGGWQYKTADGKFSLEVLND